MQRALKPVSSITFTFSWISPDCASLFSSRNAAGQWGIAVSIKLLEAHKGCMRYAVQVRKRNHMCRCATASTGFTHGYIDPLGKRTFASLLEKLGKEIKITTDKNKHVFPPRSLHHKIFFYSLQKAIGYWILCVEGFWTVKDGKEVLAKTTDGAIFSISCMENTSQRYSVRVEDIFPSF